MASWGCPRGCNQLLDPLGATSDLENFTQIRPRLCACPVDRQTVRMGWKPSNMLKLNPAKTDFMRCATHRRQHQLCTEALTFIGATIQPSSKVRGLGVILDTGLSFGPHVNQLVSRCFHQLRRIKSSVSALPTEATKTVVNSFVVSRIDYCNSL